MRGDKLSKGKKVGVRRWNKGISEKERGELKAGSDSITR